MAPKHVCCKMRWLKVRVFTMWVWIDDTELFKTFCGSAMELVILACKVRCRFGGGAQGTQCGCLILVE